MTKCVEIRTDVNYYFRKVDDFPLPEIFDVDRVDKVLSNKNEILREYVTGKKIDAIALIENTTVVKGPVFIGSGTIIKHSYIEASDELPIYIGENCTIGPFSWIRPGTIIGNGVVVRGDIKNSVLLNGVSSHHHGYMGDSIIGRNVNIATSFDTSNFKMTGGDVRICGNDTGLRKLGAIVGDYSKVGSKTTTEPGTLIGPNSWVTSGNVGGFIPENTWRRIVVDSFEHDGKPAYKEFVVDEVLDEKYRRAW